MLTFFGRRLIAAAVVVALASTLVFLSIHLLPGDPVLLLLGDQAAGTPEVVEAMRRRLNLHLPLPVQYMNWGWGVLRLDFGTSLQTGLPVVGELARRLPRSLELIAAGLLLATLVGIPLGVLGARRADGPAGWLTTIFAAVGFSAPVFVIGILLIIVFSLWAGWLPSSGYVPVGDGLGEHLRHLVLPAATLAINFSGVVIRMTRASMLDVLGRDYMRTARAKGIPERAAVYRHGLPNALIPVISVIGVRAGNLLGGTVIIEALFNWPGLSTLLVRACFDRDYPVIQGALVTIFVVFVTISVIVDLAHAAVDPRMREARAR